MFSMQDIEDTVWGEQAGKAHEEGYLTADGSEAVLSKYIDA